MAGATIFWGLRLFVSPTPAPASAIGVADGTAVRGDLSRLFGAAEVAAPDAPPPESTRFKLLGVLAAREGAAQPNTGVALISIDGKPPRPYRAGARVEDRLTLRQVSLRTAALGPADGPVAFTLEIPRMAEPATGTMSPMDPSQLQVNSPEPQPAVAPAPPVPAANGNPGGPPTGANDRFRQRGPGGPGAPR